jgi:hypothetical protein
MGEIHLLRTSLDPEGEGVVEAACMAEVEESVTILVMSIIPLEELVVEESEEVAERRELLHLQIQLRPGEEALAQEATALPVVMLTAAMAIAAVDMELQALAVLTSVMTPAFQEEATQAEEDLAQVVWKEQEEEASMDKALPIINMGTLEDMAAAVVVRAVAQVPIGEGMVGLAAAGEDLESM